MKKTTFLTFGDISPEEIRERPVFYIGPNSTLVAMSEDGLEQDPAVAGSITYYGKDKGVPYVVTDHLIRQGATSITLTQKIVTLVKSLGCIRRGMGRP